MKVYKRLRDLREDADKSQEEIARIIGGNENDTAHLESAKQLLIDAKAHK